MSDHGAERRPRPEYGEYASPEEQRAAIKQPAEWQLEPEQTDASPQEPEQGAYRPGIGQPPAPQFRAYHEQRPIAGAPARRVNPWDRLATLVLLGFGLYNVISMIANAVGDGALVRRSAATLSASDEQLLNGFPNWIWVATAVAYSVVWLIALSASLRAMRSGRIAFWIPLLAGIIATMLVLALMVIAVGENPGLLNNVPTPGGTGNPS
ncbi:DUF6264 family protein [Gryllotalpicola reticulitermitis]|uniref:DUF6264 family protein n=1 Tax=Gryllotalpicola reticulitermitis TaxID=1184153 RepID=A0ABV8Q0B7_9MICO